jgi:hypothetical protein
VYRLFIGGPDDLPAPANDELERAGLGWLMGGFPWTHGRTIITTRAAEWVQQGGDSREVRATDLQNCDWCGAGSLTMLKCGKCRLVYYCSIDCQKATWSQHRALCIACVPKRNRGDVMKSLDIRFLQRVVWGAGGGGEAGGAEFAGRRAGNVHMSPPTKNFFERNSFRQWADIISRRWACMIALWFVYWLSKATTPCGGVLLPHRNRLRQPRSVRASVGVLAQGSRDRHQGFRARLPGCGQVLHWPW